METIGRMLMARRDDAATTVAIVDESSRTSYEELAEGALRVACYLTENGVLPGDRVALLMPPSATWAKVHYGAMIAGALVVPLNLAWRFDELSFALRQSRARCVIAEAIWRGRPLANQLDGIVSKLARPAETADRSRAFPELSMGILVGRADDCSGGWRPGAEMLGYEAPPRVQDAVARRLAAASPADACCIVYTSGSGGRPKPALLHHRGLLAAAFEYGRCLAIGPADRVLVPWPTFHVSGISAGMMMAHVRSLTGWLMEAYEPRKALDLIEQEAITTFSGFDTTFTTLLGSAEFHPYRVSSVRRLLLATGPAMYDRVFKAFPNLEVASKCYAMTETCGPSALAYPSMRDFFARKYSQGLLVPGAEIRIVDPVTSVPQQSGSRGEIRIRGPLLFAGYFEMLEETRTAFDSEGWFRTGDLGRLDSEGHLFFDGRLKRLIKTGGENVSEREVEVFLEDQIPAVNIAQVVGVADPLWGEAVVAFIEPMDGADMSEAEVRLACKGKIADYKIPKRIWLVREHEWPRNDVGKISKDSLAAWAAERCAS